MSVQRALITTGMFWDLLDQAERDDRRLELIDGEIVEVSPEFKHGLRTQILQTAVANYLENNPVGEIVSEVDFYIPEDALNTRRPDATRANR
ncbi:MAG: Uma2 family endonuclease [Chloroflexota bacterium]|nr:Uma2 family endonuclease [Chloroflexota bacterium]